MAITKTKDESFSRIEMENPYIDSNRKQHGGILRVEILNRVMYKTEGIAWCSAEQLKGYGPEVRLPQIKSQL